MNLLEATTTLIDAVKTHAPEDDRIIARAVKRMEKRLFVLQVRQAKSRKRNRVKAFWQAVGLFDGGILVGESAKKGIFLCPGCKGRIFFGDFCRNAEFSGGGNFQNMNCPHCSLLMARGGLAT